MKRTAIIISPNWRDYAEKYLGDCLESLVRQDYQGPVKYFFIDNESTAESMELFRAAIDSRLPEFFDKEIFGIKHNAGFAEANNLAMRSALDQGFDYLILLNIDTVSDPSAIRELVAIAEQRPEIGAVQARLMLWQDKEKINSLGNETHFLGFGFCEGYNEPIGKHPENAPEKKIFYPSGAGVLYKGETLKKIGLFDEVFWMYAEDQDLGWRIWLSGQECVLARNAVVYHNYEFSRSVQKYYWMNRNRLLVMLKNYHFLTLLLIAPAFLAMELGQLFFSWRGGWLNLQLKTYAYFLRPATWKYLLRERRTIQAARTVADRNIKDLFSSVIEYQEIMSAPLRIANFIFNLYWRIIKPIIIW
jgi:GT2 family glycosyltransferase